MYEAHLIHNRNDVVDTSATLGDVVVAQNGVLTKRESASVEGGGEMELTIVGVHLGRRSFLAGGSWAWVVVIVFDFFRRYWLCSLKRKREIG